MKRFLLGLLTASYLALIGVQAAHFHKDALESTTDSCAVCVMAHQSVAQAPHAAPTAVQASDFHTVAPSANAVVSGAFAAEASARAPPAAV